MPWLQLPSCLKLLNRMVARAENGSAFAQTHCAMPSPKPASADHPPLANGEVNMAYVLVSDAAQKFGMKTAQLERELRQHDAPSVLVEGGERYVRAPDVLLWRIAIILDAFAKDS